MERRPVYGFMTFGHGMAIVYMDSQKLTCVQNQGCQNFRMDEVALFIEWAIDSWWLMREEESLSLRNVAAGRLLMAPTDDQMETLIVPNSKINEKSSWSWRRWTRRH